MTDPEALAGEIVGDEANLPATRPLPGPPSSAGAGLTSTLANLPPERIRAVIAHSAEVARELRAVIDGVKGRDGKPALVTTFTRKGVTSEHLREGAWSLLGSMVGVGVKVVDQRPVDYSHPVHRPRAIGWESMAVAFDRASGEDLAAEWGMCLRSDGDQWASGAEYALRGMSATRAKVRAMKAVLGHVATLAGYDPTPAEERDVTGGADGDGFPEGAKRPTAAQRRKIDEALAKLDVDRGGDCPVSAGWREYLDAFLARRLRGRGLAGLTREEAERALKRLEALVAGGEVEPVEPPGAPAPGPAAAPEPGRSVTGSGAPAASAEGRIRARQLRREAEERELDEEALEALLAPLGVRVDRMAEDLAADSERYRKALEAVRGAARARHGRSEDADAAGEADTPAAPENAAEGPAGAAAGGSEECPACGEAVAEPGLCSACAALGLGGES